MATKWERTGQTKAPISKAIEFFMNPENRAKVQPKLVKEVKILSREGDTITWEQRSRRLGMNIRSVTKHSLDRASNTFEIQVTDGPAKGSIMTRALKSIPTGTEVHCTYSLKAGALGLFMKGRAKKTFEDTVDEDMKALDALA
jgi:hypothetical protein